MRPSDTVENIAPLPSTDVVVRDPRGALPQLMNTRPWAEARDGLGSVAIAAQP
jgi:hypothetical protein